MSEHMFGVGRAKINPAHRAKIDDVASRFDAQFHNPRLPDGYQYWFTCENRGEPFDSRTAREVMAALDAAGLKLP
jgi:hypothetical protein